MKKQKEKRTKEKITVSFLLLFLLLFRLLLPEAFWSVLSPVLSCHLCRCCLLLFVVLVVHCCLLNVVACLLSRWLLVVDFSLFMVLCLLCFFGLA